MKEIAQPSSDGRKIVESLKGKIHPPDLSKAYRLGAVAVAPFLFLLPLVYISLLAVVVVPVVMLLASEGTWDANPLLVVIPVTVAAILVFFLLKPLLAGVARPPARRALTRESEPVLFEYVTRLCRVVGAPVPDRIEVDTLINASAGLHLGLVNRDGGQLVLTIGLPLVAGLSLRQLTGVLAHEFGHFTQGSGLLLTQAIFDVNSWFARVVYQRDAWDERILRWSRNSPIRIVTGVLVLARFLIAASRGILRLLMWVAHGVSCFLTRQMELHADLFEARVAGGETFARTCLQLRVLELASEMAVSDLEAAYSEGRLADDLPALIAWRSGDLPAKVVKGVRKSMMEVQTSIFDTHPSDRHRIESVRREGPGLFQLDGQASDLFSDFPKLCRAVTMDFYREVLGQGLSPKNVQSTAELVRDRQVRRAKAEVRNRYLQGVPVSGSRLFFLSTAEIPAPAEDLPSRLSRLREAQLAVCADARQAYFGIEEARARRLNAAIGLALKESRLSFRPKDLGLRSGSTRSIEEEKQAADQLETRARGGIEKLDRFVEERILLGLSGLRDPNVRRPETAGHLELATRLLRTLIVLRGSRSAILEAPDRLSELEAFVERVGDGRSRPEEPRKHAHRIVESLGRLMVTVERGLADEPYPYPHAEGSISLRRYLFPLRERGTVPTPEGVPDGGPERTAWEVYRLGSRFRDLHERLVDDLVALADEVELTLGLPPLPEPPEV